MMSKQDTNFTPSPKDHDHSPRKQPQPSATNNNINNNNCSTTNERLMKRDEWSEGAVSCLLEAYESKWSLRNRAKLKGQDWEQVAKHVSARENNSKSPKTQTQCKNKIESMKKRYRSESSAAVDAPPSWPLYHRLDILLRGGNGPPAGAAPPRIQVVANPPEATVVLETTPALHILPAAAAAGSFALNSHGSDGVDLVAKGDGNKTGNNTKLPHQELAKDQINDSDSSTPALYTDQKENSNSKSPLKTKTKGTKRKREECWGIGESIRWVAEMVVRSEQARMETIREIERMRLEGEEKRGEIDLKRTEIIANTQLQIAKLFAKGSVDSSLRVGRS